MKSTELIKQLKEHLEVSTNEDVLATVEGLMQIGQAPVIVAVRWVPGQPLRSAVVQILSDSDIPLHCIHDAFRAGQAVCEAKTQETLLQMERELARLRAATDSS